MSEFNKTLAEFLRKQEIHGDIGLEIEVEGRNILKNKIPRLWWHIVPDGSLRGQESMEFVLTIPILKESLNEALTEFQSLTSDAKFNYSGRCSIHIHVNASKFTLKQVYNAYGIYWLLDNILVKMNGPSREGNLFCLRVKDAEDLARQFFRSLKDKIYVLQFKDNVRYSSLNPCALSKYGSFEFRFIEANYDIKNIKLWVDNLFNFIQKTKDISIIEVIKMMEVSPYRVMSYFFDNELNDRMHEYYNKHTLYQDMSENIPLSLELYRLLNKQEYFTPAILQLTEDIIEPNELLEPLPNGLSEPLEGLVEENWEREDNDEDMEIAPQAPFNHDHILRFNNNYLIIDDLVINNRFENIDGLVINNRFENGVNNEQG